MQYTDEFLALTQVGVALTGFMGIVITLRTGALSALGAVSRARVRDLLYLPLGVVFFALAPSIITGSVTIGKADVGWIVCSPAPAMLNSILSEPAEAFETFIASRKLQ